MFKIQKLFVSESSYKTDNVRCLLNENLEFIGFVSVSVSVICICPPSVLVLHIHVRVHVRVMFISCPCLCPMSVFVSCLYPVFVVVLHIHVCVLVTLQSRWYGYVTVMYICILLIPSHIYSKHQYMHESGYESMWYIIHSNI